MTVLQCKRCGAPLPELISGSVVECEYCGSKVTVPTIDDDKKAAMFARADKLLRDCRFDEAAARYEAIISDFPNEAEGYWGLVLCKYGIEYVDDPVTAKKIPTCHRSSFEAVTDDDNFKNLLECADPLARPIYRQQAKEIEELRRDIIELSSKEEPFDIFICYKETDGDGNRTEDSVLAQQVYTDLTEKGYKVFFSKITLEDRLGTEYEPFIFAALHSSKIMLAFGTDYEYFNAVWVKNEWSRFLQLIAKGERKTLIPCFKYIDPSFDMPKEFARLQAQDMSKLGWEQDLLRGIEKILPKSAPLSAPAPSVNPLMERAYIFLESGDFEKADIYCERVLDEMPRCAGAYLCKLLCELKLRRESELESASPDFVKKDNFIKALQFADENMQKRLSHYANASEQAEKDRQQKKAQAQEQEKRQQIESLLTSGKSSLEKGDFGGAEQTFASLVRKDGGALSDAYMGIVLAQRQVRDISSLVDFAPLDKDVNFQNAVKHAAPEQKAQYNAINEAAVFNTLMRFIDSAAGGNEIFMELWANHYKNSALAEGDICKAVDILCHNRGISFAAKTTPGALLLLANALEKIELSVPEQMKEAAANQVYDLYEKYMDGVFGAIIKPVTRPSVLESVTQKYVADKCELVFGATLTHRQDSGPRLYRDMLLYSLYVDSQSQSLQKYLRPSNTVKESAALPDFVVTDRKELIELCLDPAKSFCQKTGLSVHFKTDPLSRSERIYGLIRKLVTALGYVDEGTAALIKSLYGEAPEKSTEFIKSLSELACYDKGKPLTDFLYEYMPESPKLNLLKLIFESDKFTIPTVTLTEKYLTYEASLSQYDIHTFQKEYRSAQNRLIIKLELKKYAEKAFAQGENRQELEKWESYRDNIRNRLGYLKDVYDRSVARHNDNYEKERKKSALKNLFSKNKQPDVFVPELRLPSENGTKVTGLGVIKQVHKSVGDYVKKGDVLFTVSSMSMQFTITAKQDGKLTELFAEQGFNADFVGCILCTIE